MDKTLLYYKAMDKWGSDSQIKMCIEELAELIQALAKLGRNINGSDFDNVAEEIADVEICTEQIKQIFLLDGNVDQYKYKKLQRLENLLSEVVNE
jgi:NTP pyrophosphatase (non-canonical NTP hydrolase)